MPPCKVDTLLGDLPEEDAVALATWCSSTELDLRGKPVSRWRGVVVSAAALSTSLHHAGHTVSPTALKDHRALRCGCARQG